MVEPPPTFVGISINRNILECKGCIHFPERCRVLVLIETYWNVKSSAPALYASFRTVLIETYWNVKAEFSKIIYHSVSRINRNILECKEAQKNRDWQAQQSY